MNSIHLIARTAATAMLTGAGAAAFAQTLLWSDEFDGPYIDQSRWTYNVGNSGFGNGELQYYTARLENARIEDGELVITARRENFGGSQFTSARLITQGRVDFKYADVEVRFKAPDLAEGLWPAIWTLGSNFGQQGWPGCGEIDILEMGDKGARDAGVTNNRIISAAHWNFGSNYANYSEFYESPTPLTDDYHILRMEWTPTAITTFIDDNQIWRLNINDPETNSLEEFHNPGFLLINLAVGGFNFVQLTNPADITAPFPAEFRIDYVRVYDNGFTDVRDLDAMAEPGDFGIFTDTTPVESEITFGTDAEFYLWNNMTAAPETPQEGENVWSFDIGAGDWWGGGVFCLQDRNLSGHSDGVLHFHAKTASIANIDVGVSSSGAGEVWVTITPAMLPRDGQWHEVQVPLSQFQNIDWNTILQAFMIRGSAPAAPFRISIDNVWLEPNGPRPTPADGDFVVYSNTSNGVETFELGADGEFYVWENTLIDSPTDSFEGGDVLSFQSAAGLDWFGAAFTPNGKYDLSAFRHSDSKLRFAMKTTSSTPFSIGMKSGSMNDIGQRWIRFAPGADPYGFQRDGNWHVVEIPMEDFLGYVDLTDVSQLFQLLGTEGAISDLAIDDVVFTGGEDPLGGAPASLEGWYFF